MMLEALEHTSASFVTLTYDRENVPADGSVSVRALQLFLKRLRKNVHPNPLRFFGVGEYGEFTWRPHYHLALFGLGPDGQELVDRSWGLGFVMSGSLTHHSAAYVASYVNKKMTGKDDERLLGRHPEFARMSLRPGLGAFAADEIASALLCASQPDRVAEVPAVLRHGGKEFPLGRYLKRRVRERVGLSANQTQEEAFVQSLEVRALREDFILATRSAPARKQTFSEYLASLDQQAFLNTQTRRRIWASKKGIGL